MNDRYGEGNWQEGPGSEYNQIQKCGTETLTKSDNVTTEFYPVAIRDTQKDYFVLWFMQDEASNLLTEQSVIKVFASLEELYIYCQTKNMKVEKRGKIFRLDFEKLAGWIDGPFEQFDSTEILNSWNLLDDAWYSSHRYKRKEKKRVEDVYQKLFWSTNPPSLVPDGQKFIPSWSLQEIKLLKSHLKELLNSFSQHVQNGDRT